MKYKDARMKLTSQVINNMKVIKMFGWEEKFYYMIEEIRKSELRDLTNRYWCFVSNVLTFAILPIGMTLGTFVFYSLVLNNGMPLDMTIVYPVLAIFAIIREPMMNFPFLLGTISEFGVALRRIHAFLQTDEVNLKQIKLIKDLGHDYAIEVDKSNFSWNIDEPTVMRESVDN